MGTQQHPLYRINGMLEQGGQLFSPPWLGSQSQTSSHQSWVGPGTGVRCGAPNPYHPRYSQTIYRLRNDQSFQYFIRCSSFHNDFCHSKFDLLRKFKALFVKTQIFLLVTQHLHESYAYRQSTQGKNVLNMMFLPIIELFWCLMTIQGFCRTNLQNKSSSKQILFYSSKIM